MAGTHLRRRRQEQGLHYRRQLRKPLAPLAVGLGVLAREPRHRLEVFLVVRAGDGQGPSVREGVERRPHGIDLVPVTLQTQLVDDAPRHQTHHVRVGGDVELRRLGPRRVRARRPPNLVAGLQYHRAQPVAREIGPRRKPIVPPADDYGIKAALHHPLPSGAEDFTKPSFNVAFRVCGGKTFLVDREFPVPMDRNVGLCYLAH